MPLPETVFLFKFLYTMVLGVDIAMYSVISLVLEIVGFCRGYMAILIYLLARITDPASFWFIKYFHAKNQPDLSKIKAFKTVCDFMN